MDPFYCGLIAAGAFWLTLEFFVSDRFVWAAVMAGVFAGAISGCL